MKQLLLALILLSNIAFSQDGKFQELSYKCKDGKKRPFVVYTPKEIANQAGKPLLVYLHGAISNPVLKPNPLEYMRTSKLVELADKGGFHLMFSYGQMGAGWFDAVGVDMVVNETKIAQKKLKANADKLVLSGFSDGGSGVLYISTLQPNLFAGYIAMNGSISIASRLSKGQLFLSNINQRPMFIINTTKDMLYYIEQIRPTIDYLKKFNNNIIFKEPEGNHEMAYLEDEALASSLCSFISDVEKKPLQSCSWESMGADNSVNGIYIQSVDTLKEKADWHQRYDLKVLNNKALLGVKFDRSHRGKGLKIKGFKSDTATAKRLGALPGDIIIAMEEDTMKSPFDRFMYISKKRIGQPTSLTINRGGEILVLKGKFNEGYLYQAFKNQDKTAKIQADIQQGELSIKTSCVKELALNIKTLKSLGVKTLKVDGKSVKLKKRGTQTILVK